MSATDFENHGADVPQLIGRRCFLTLATNSLKLHIDADKKGGIYLWIDPPWQFGKDGEIIESSASYPFEGDKEGFTHWTSRFAPIRESRFEQIEAQPDGSLWITLADDYQIFVPKEFIPREPDDAFSWYDHWYLNLSPSEP
ncbi:hypothetical protein [Luteolibacter sp. LG18]|uniref:hypothetical protein n=1 Tax=Luteolibacter sp. LG18 TaxID=2819286 RepID=UPI002B2CC9BE|nr:hypothetical protein llg_23300 [Luteolibacter sp. LG18]